MVAEEDCREVTAEHNRTHSEKKNRGGTPAKIDVAWGSAVCASQDLVGSSWHLGRNPRSQQIGFREKTRKLPIKR